MSQTSNFDDIYNNLPNLLEDLRKCELCGRDDRRIPKGPGIYSFWEKDRTPLYVGRASKLRERIQQHSRKSSGQNIAAFAFRLALDSFKASKILLNKTKKTRNGLVSDGKFKEEFNKAKERIGKMKVRFVKIEDANTQAIFEVYAAMNLKTRFNNFDNH